MFGENTVYPTINLTMATFVAVAEGPTELLPWEKAVLGARHTTIVAPNQFLISTSTIPETSWAHNQERNNRCQTVQQSGQCPLPQEMGTQHNNQQANNKKIKLS